MLTLIPDGPSSAARSRAKDSSADLAAPYGLWGNSGTGLIEACDPISTTDPPPASTKWGSTARTTCTAPSTLTVRLSSQSSSVVRCHAPFWVSRAATLTTA